MKKTFIGYLLISLRLFFFIFAAQSENNQPDLLGFTQVQGNDQRVAVYKASDTKADRWGWLYADVYVEEQQRIGAWSKVKVFGGIGNFTVGYIQTENLREEPAFEAESAQPRILFTQIQTDCYAYALPDELSAALGKIANGIFVGLLGETQDWYYIDICNTRCFVKKDAITLQQSVWNEDYYHVLFYHPWPVVTVKPPEEGADPFFDAYYLPDKTCVNDRQQAANMQVELIANLGDMYQVREGTMFYFIESKHIVRGIFQGEGAGYDELLEPPNEPVT